MSLGKQWQPYKPPQSFCMVCLLDKGPSRPMPHKHTRWERVRYHVTTSKPVVIVQNWLWQRKNGRL